MGGRRMVLLLLGDAAKHIKSLPWANIGMSYWLASQHTHQVSITGTDHERVQRALPDPQPRGRAVIRSSACSRGGMACKHWPECEMTQCCTFDHKLENANATLGERVLRW